MAEDIEDPDDDRPLFGPDPDNEPLFGPTAPLNPAPPVPPPVVMMVPLTIVSDATFVAPAVMMVPHFPLTPAPVTLDNDDENEYDHIDNRAIDVTLDMPSANPSIMNVTSHRHETYANLSCQHKRLLFTNLVALFYAGSLNRLRSCCERTTAR